MNVIERFFRFSKTAPSSCLEPAIGNGFAAGTEPADAVDHQGRDPHVKVSGNGASRPPARGALVPRSLIRALNDYVRQEIEPLVELNPHMRFQIHEIVTRMTPENFILLEPLTRLPERSRSNVGEQCIKEANGAGMLDRNRYYGWTIKQDSTGPDAQVYTQVAGTGFENCKLDFMFYGDWIEVDESLEPAAPVAGKPALATHSDRGITPSRSADEHHVAQGPALLSLTANNPDGTLRSLEIHNARDLPTLIGRGSACDFGLDNPYIARQHARIDFDARTGQLTIQNCSDKGLHIQNPDGRITRIAQGATEALPGPHGMILLSPTANGQSARIQYACARAAADDMSTLLPPTATAQQTANQETIAIDDRPGVESAETIMPGGSGVLAWVEVRYANGQLQRQAITHTPFVIGRDPKSSSGMTIDDPGSHVSRRHLVIEKRQAGAFLTENLAYGQSGTWRAGGDAIGPRFVWRPERGSAGSDSHPGAGWLCLAGQAEASVQVRLLTA